MCKPARLRMAATVIALVLTALILTGCCCYCTPGARRFRPFRWPRWRMGQAAPSHALTALPFALVWSWG